MHPYRLTHYGAEALEDKASSAMPGTRDARTFEVGGRLSQAFRDGGLDTQVGTKRAGFKTGALPMATPFANKNTPGKFAPKAAPKPLSLKFKPSGGTPSLPKAGQKPQQPMQKPSTQKPSQRLFAEQAVPQKPSQKPQTAPKGGTGKPQTAYLAETAKLIGMGFTWQDAQYYFGSVAVSGVLYPTVMVTPYTWSGDTRLVGTPVLYDPTSADWSAVAFKALTAFKAYNDDIAARNAAAPATTTPVPGTSADVAVLVTPAPDTIAPAGSGGSTMRVTEDTSTSDYTPASEGFVLPTSDAEVISMSATALASEMQTLADEGLMEGDMLPAEVTTVSLSEAEPAPQGGFLSQYKWWLVGGATAVAIYAVLHRTNPSAYPLPAALSKLVR